MASRWGGLGKLTSFFSSSIFSLSLSLLRCFFSLVLTANDFAIKLLTRVLGELGAGQETHGLVEIRASAPLLVKGDVVVDGQGAEAAIAAEDEGATDGGEDGPGLRGVGDAAKEGHRQRVKQPEFFLFVVESILNLFLHRAYN